MLPLNDQSHSYSKHDHFSGGPFLFAGPTTEAQREMWSAILMTQEATLCYNEVLEVRFLGDLNVGALNKSLSKMLENHDALNSLFSDDGKTFFIQTPRPVNLSALDLSCSTTQTQEISALKQKEVLTPFDLRSGPCIRFTLIKKNHQDHLLLVAAHHIVCDGWSFAVLLSELGQTYSAILDNAPIPAKSSNQFTDYAIEELQNGQNESHKKYWLDQFKRSLDVQTFPTDFVRPAFRSYNSEFLRIDISDDLVQSIKRLGIGQGSSLYNVLMANFMILMKKISSSPDTVVGVASAAQSSAGKLDLVGHMVSLLPLRVSINEALPFTQFLRSLRGSMLDAFDHQSISFGTLLKELNIPRKASEIPLLNCVFNIDQQSPGQGLHFTGLEASYVVVPRSFENFELFVNAINCGKALSLECQYNSKLFNRSTVQNWLECYVDLLRILTLDPNIRFQDITLPQLIIPKAHEDLVSTNDMNLVRCHETESRLIKIWKIVLGLNQVMPEDNFFMLGGHSLLAVELANLLQTEFRKDISIKDIFENSSIIELASFIAKTSDSLVTQTSIEVRHDIVEGPVSHNQMQTWYIEELFPETRMHNLSTSLRIKWALDPRIMEKTIHYFINRHEALRTAIFLKNDLPYQRILNPNDSAFHLPLELVQTNEREVVGLMRSETAKAFDKTLAPMFKVKLYQLGGSDYVLFMSVHHAVWDGWCFDIFFEELDVIYSAFESGLAPEFKRNPEIRYLDHTLWLQKSIDNGSFAPQLKFWKNQLKGPLPVLEIPTDFKRPVMPSHDGGNFRFALKHDQIEMIKTFAASKNVSVFNVMLTAFKIAMAHFTGMNDIIVGSPVRGRNSPELLQTIGYFVNTLALRSQIDLDLDFEANLKRVTQTCLEAFSHQDYPFELLLREIDYARDFGRTAIFQTFFTFQDMTNRQFYINERPVQQVSVNNASVKTDLDIWVKVTTTGIEGAIEYRSDLFKKSTIEKFYQSFDFILGRLFLKTSLKDELPKIDPPLSPLTLFTAPKLLASTIQSDNSSLSEMRNIWQEILGVGPINSSDSFFELGGNSLLAVKLFSSLEKRFNLDLILSDLIQAPDLKSFSQLFDSKKLIPMTLEIPTLTLSLIPLRKNGTHKPIFFFHGVGGNILNYVPLTRHIDPEYPVYALQSQGIEGTVKFKTTIEEMASAYIREIRTVSPKGPYVLVGGSMGGLIAFEVAQQLLSQGDQIERLVLLDTFGPDVNIQKYDKNERSFIENISISFRYRVKIIMNRIQKSFYHGLGLSVPLEIRLFDAEVSNYKALWKYRPKQYTGNIELIRAKIKPSGWYSDPHMGWSNTILGHINITEIDGQHRSFIESPQLGQVLAQQLH